MITTEAVTHYGSYHVMPITNKEAKKVQLMQKPFWFFWNDMMVFISPSVFAEA